MEEENKTRRAELSLNFGHCALCNSVATVYIYTSMVTSHILFLIIARAPAPQLRRCKLPCDSVKLCVGLDSARGIRSQRLEERYLAILSHPVHSKDDLGRQPSSPLTFATRASHFCGSAHVTYSLPSYL